MLESCQLFAVSSIIRDWSTYILHDFTPRYSRHGRIFTLPEDILSNFRVDEDHDVFLDGEIW